VDIPRELNANKSLREHELKLRLTESLRVLDANVGEDVLVIIIGKHRRGEFRYRRDFQGALGPVLPFLRYQTVVCSRSSFPKVLMVGKEFLFGEGAYSTSVYSP
jgi:hypothetical protein